MMGVPLDKVVRIIKPENRLLGLKKTFESGGEGTFHSPQG